MKLTTLLAAIPLILLTAAPSSATSDPLGPALHRIGSGTYTAADVRMVKRSPLAGQVPDNRSKPVLHASSGTLSAKRGSCGHWVDVWFRQRSYLGSTIFKWHHRVIYCMTHRRITRWQSRYDYLTKAQSIVYVRGLLVNRRGGLHTRRAWSHKQRHLEYCIVKYGCYASVYPWSIIKVYAGGGYRYRGSAH